MSSPIRFDGRVAIVTGAGGGLGRVYALAFASRGASVVVNDLGGDIKGGGKSARAADLVVEEIRAAGGKAVANYNSVEDGEAIVKTALDAFGRVDILVNNAGILRDKSFARTSDVDWDLIHQVHLRGSFMVTRAAWPHMRKQNYGRIIMTTSAAGVYGNFGQANYSAAKLGLLGLSNTLAVEGAKYNITCNSIAPTAESRLTKTVMPEDMLQNLKPHFVAPLVLYLCHESCEETHGLFEVGGGWIGKLRWQRSQGKMLRTQSSPNVTPEEVRDQWANICSWTNAEYPETIQESVSKIMAEIERENVTPPSGKLNPVQAAASSVDVAKIKRHTFPPQPFSYNAKSLALYALGIGADAGSPDSPDLKFVYEGDDAFSAIPSFGVIPAQGSLAQVMMGIDGLDFNPMMLLHGEQYLELHAPFPTEGEVTSQAKIVDILDKGKGALVILNVETRGQDSSLICTNQFSLFIRGIGGFGGPSKSASSRDTLPVPAGAPDAIEQDRTSEKQAALYRLSGDLNPLHIDPQMAAVAGFKKPILHGLCSFGFATRHVLRRYANNDPSLFKAIKVRFASPVYPGETIQTEMWLRGQRVHFQCRVLERDVLVLSNSYVDLHSVAAADTASPSRMTTAPSAGLASVPLSGGLKAEAIFADMESLINADMVKKVKAIFQWNITKDGKTAGVWTVDLKNGDGALYKGDAKEKAGCTLTLSDDTLEALVSGKLDSMKAFMSGKLKISGNIMLSSKLKNLFDAKKAAGAGPSGGAKPAAPKSPSSGLKAEEIFETMSVAVNADTVKKVKAIFQWNITKDGKTAGVWTVDLKNGDGSLYKGDAKEKAGCTLTLSDDTLEALVSGKIDAMKAFMSGKLKIKGNMMLAQKLQVLMKPQAKL